MTAHAFNVDFSIEAGIEFFIPGGQIPNAFLGVKSEGGLVQVFTISPKMAVCMLSTAHNVGDFFPAIVNGISSLKSEFLDIK